MSSAPRIPGEPSLRRGGSTRRRARSDGAPTGNSPIPVNQGLVDQPNLARTPLPRQPPGRLDRHLPSKAGWPAPTAPRREPSGAWPARGGLRRARCGAPRVPAEAGVPGRRVAGLGWWAPRRGGSHLFRGGLRRARCGAPRVPAEAGVPGRRVTWAVELRAEVGAILPRRGVPRGLRRARCGAPRVPAEAGVPGRRRQPGCRQPPPTARQCSSSQRSGQSPAGSRTSTERDPEAAPRAGSRNRLRLTSRQSGRP